MQYIFYTYNIKRAHVKIAIMYEQKLNGGWEGSNQKKLRINPRPLALTSHQ